MTDRANRVKGEKELLEYMRKRGLTRVRDVIKAGFHPDTVRRLHKKDQIIRLSRGLYVHPKAIPTEHPTIVEIAKRVPHGVICLLTALRLHNIGTQNPRAVWIAISARARMPKIDYPKIRVIRFSGTSFTEGIEHRTLSGIETKIYNPAKTVVDCFRYRHQVGLDVAIEALKESIQSRRCTIDDIWKFAEVDGVTKTMMPYLMAVTA